MFDTIRVIFNIPILWSQIFVHPLLNHGFWGVFDLRGKGSLAHSSSKVHSTINCDFHISATLLEGTRNITNNSDILLNILGILNI